MTNNKHNANIIKEPLVRVARREGVSRLKAFFIKLVAIILACIVCLAAIYLLTGPGPDNDKQALRFKAY